MAAFQTSSKDCGTLSDPLRHQTGSEGLKLLIDHLYKTDVEPPTKTTNTNLISNIIINKYNGLIKLDRGNPTMYFSIEYCFPPCPTNMCVNIVVRLKPNNFINMCNSLAPCWSHPPRKYILTSILLVKYNLFYIETFYFPLIINKK